jgi:hypothetical protein
MSKLIIDICLSDIPKEVMTEAKNGKKYVKLSLVERKEPGKYGETHFVAITQTKEQREAKAPTVYVGSAKPMFSAPKQPTADESPKSTDFVDTVLNGGTDDLPF